MELFDRIEWINRKEELVGIDKEECNFCKIGEKVIDDYIIWKGKYFYIAHNKYPVLGLKNNLLVIPFKHHLESKDMSSKEFEGFKEVEQFMYNYYKGEKYFSFIRQSMKGRSMAHIHWQYLPGIFYYKYLEEMLKDQGYPKKLLRT